ncbi:MAG TPA: hypothetical protein PKY82_14205 [Pyrinomonadaceae bacterium]|nr:hypothetical protein [Pyrinomonadaceae bacterium]
MQNGNFSVNHYGGSNWGWTRISTYKYLPKDKTWYPFKDGEDNYHKSDPNKVKTTINPTKNFGKIPFKKLDIYKEDK